MDVTPQLLKDVEFREKFRGYDPDEVDDFLERVGVAFAQLQDKLREANDQIESANARAAQAKKHARDSSDIDDTLRRTLVLAQRTADAAVKEAEEQAAAITADADTKTRQQLSGSEERASQILGAAEAEARRKLDAADGQASTVLASGETQAEATLAAAREQANRLLMDSRCREAEDLVAAARTSADEIAEKRRVHLAEEVTVLEVRREALSRNAELLEAHVGSQRARLQVTFEDLRTLLEHPERLAATPPPALEPEPAALVGDSTTTVGESTPVGSVGDDVQIAEPITVEAAADVRSAQPVLDLTAGAQVDAMDGVGAAGTEVDENGTGRGVELGGPAPFTEPAPTQQLDLSALEREDAAAREQSLAAAPSVGGVPSSPVVGPSTWPAGGPPPPPPPPTPSDRLGGEQRAEPPAPPPPPVEVGVGAGSGVPPWLAARTPPSVPQMPPPPRGCAAFLDELKRAVGDDDAGADTGETAAAGSVDDNKRPDAGEKSADETKTEAPAEGESTKSWFGRRR